MGDKLKPAVIAGGALGLVLVFTVLLASVPVLKFAGCCNCLWPIAAGLLGTLLYIKGSPTPATIVDGLTVGAIAGVIGGLIYLIIGLPLSYLINGTAALDAQMRQLSPDFPLTGEVLMVIGGLVGFVIYIVLAIIGGLIAVPIFEKRKGAVETPPPPQPPYGPGGGPGNYGSGI